MWLLIGLGNPGQKYAKSRHNIGFMVADALGGPTASWKKKFQGLSATTYVRLFGQDVTVVKPLTYMNLSGEAVLAAMGEFKVPVENVIVVVDEYNFPVGRLHLRKGGSAGGHNGLTSVIEELGTDQFWRLRCGIDRRFGPGGMADYVLGDFESEEIEARDAMIAAAVEAITLVMKAGPDRAMKEINSASPR
jgi:PTH1 family peptidyl-tRNA hydrolase